MKGTKLEQILIGGTFLTVLSYAAYHSGSTFPKLSTFHMIIVELIVLTICQFSPLSDFASRKLCHSISGLMMLHLDPSDPLATYFIYAVALGSLAMVWEIVPFSFRFSQVRDVGISVYLVIVMAFFTWKIPLEIINPVFFADPLGALVGKYLTKANIPNPRWIGEKTIGGSMAVFLATVVTLGYGTLVTRVILAIIVTVVEGVTLQFDNLFITAVVILGYLLMG